MNVININRISGISTRSLRAPCELSASWWECSSSGCSRSVDLCPVVHPKSVSMLVFFYNNIRSVFLVELLASETFIYALVLTPTHTMLSNLNQVNTYIQILQNGRKSQPTISHSTRPPIHWLVPFQHCCLHWEFDVEFLCVGSGLLLCFTYVFWFQLCECLPFVFVCDNDLFVWMSWAWKRIALRTTSLHLNHPFCWSNIDSCRFLQQAMIFFA